MCVGFVNAGIMKLRQTVGIIMGANIGTTVTAQLLRLGDISSDNFFLSLLNPATLGPILATVGIIFYMFITGGRKKCVGQIVLGLGLLFIGMETLENVVAPLQDLPAFRDLFVAFSNPFLGVLVGALVTAIIQSSSASMGILQAMTSTGVITFRIAVPLIMGQNIGTCITAILSSIGASKNAKRTACLHLLFNILGTLFFLVVLYGGNALFHFSFWEALMDRGTIANLHLGFNVCCTALLLPFNRQLVWLVEHLIPGSADQKEVSVLDERFLSTPALALEKAHEAVVQMGCLAQENYRLAVELLSHFDAKKLERINETEAALDKLETNLDNYLVRLSGHPLTAGDSAKVSELLHTLSDFERIGDYVINLAQSAHTLHERNLVLSDAAREELSALCAAVDGAVDQVLDCYTQRSPELAQEVEPIEEVVDLMENDLRSRHIERLKAGQCTVEMGAQYLEILINLERISDHCSNVALYILQETSPAGSLIRTDAHAYMHALHHGEDPVFDEYFQFYRDKYYAPIERTGC